MVVTKQKLVNGCQIELARNRQSGRQGGRGNPVALMVVYHPFSSVSYVAHLGRARETVTSERWPRKNRLVWGAARWPLAALAQSN